jgi:hypothetical protein
MTDFETKHEYTDPELVNQEERDRLLYELVVRQSALEKMLIKTGVITERALAEAQIECMEKLQEIIDKRTSTESNSGFIKYGDSNGND